MSDVEFETPAKPIEILLSEGRVLRQITPDDLEDLLGFFEQNREFFEEFAPKLAFELSNEHRLAAEIPSPPPPFEDRLQFIGISDGTIFGYFHIDPTNSEGPAEIGYSVGKDEANRGLATEAAGALLKYAFENLAEPIVRVTIEAGFEGEHRNEASLAVARKLGFTPADEFGIKYYGRYRHMQHFEINKEEFEGLQQPQPQPES